MPVILTMSDTPSGTSPTMPLIQVAPGSHCSFEVDAMNYPWPFPLKPAAPTFQPHNANRSPSSPLASPLSFLPLDDPTSTFVNTIATTVHDPHNMQDSPNFLPILLLIVCVYTCTKGHRPVQDKLPHSDFQCPFHGQGIRSRSGSQDSLARVLANEDRAPGR